ncbi:multiple epidermal growth factor-like domains protein 10 isoform X1 [Saccostrea cucullata]|uniref:multiple epidermal growth factor-like domains protein 10 isoform X1 n=1 Tax=Saccostrea cuccullata TaxID=36930 RepID=UPI002ED3BDBB
MTTKITQIRLLFIWFFKTGPICGQSNCTGYPNGCCPGFRWNNITEKCTECEAGFSGINCIRKCLYPSYGLKCKQKCACSNDSCDFISGCYESSTLTLQTTESKIDYIVVTNQTKYADDFNFTTVFTNKESRMPSHMSLIVLSLSLCVIIALVVYGSLKVKKKLKRLKTTAIDQEDIEEDTYQTIEDKNLSTRKSLEIRNVW